MIVTDLAARGVDIPLINNVVHFDFPPNMKLFIHRSGRTARAGKSGKCYCLLTKEETAYMMEVGLYVGREFTNDPLDKKINDVETGVYGRIPQQIID